MEKTKRYSALCWTADPVTEATLLKLQTYKVRSCWQLLKNNQSEKQKLGIQIDQDITENKIRYT